MTDPARRSSPGEFTVAGGTPVNRVAKWDGSSWADVGGGLSDGLIIDFCVFDDGSGPALYAAGSFVSAGGQVANNVAKWDGIGWTPLGTGTIGVVRQLEIFDAGSGPRLYAAGNFISAGGIAAAKKVASWDGNQWSPVGSFTVHDVYGMKVFDAGNGPALYAADYSAPLGSSARSTLARWDGSTWTDVVTNVVGGINLLEVLDDGTGEALYAGGGFSSVGGVPAARIARWDGTAWEAMGTGFSYAAVRALISFDDAFGRSIVAGGSMFLPNVSQWREPRELCPVDLNNDCERNIYDLFALLDLFNQQDPDADINGDGGLNFLDIVAYIAAFNQGCP